MAKAAAKQAQKWAWQPAAAWASGGSQSCSPSPRHGRQRSRRTGR
jgi:hypothetical protein